MTAVDQRSTDPAWAALLPERDAAVRVAAARCGHSYDAEDCAHDALVRAATFPALDLDRAGRLLMTTTARVAVDEHRREQARTRAELAAAARAFAQAESPEEEVCDRAEADWLARQVDDLPPTERNVLLARAAGESTRQTAQRLGLAEKTVENALGRARSKMTRRWRETLSAVLLPVALARKAFGAHAAVSATATALAAATGVTVLVLGHAAAPAAPPVQARPLPATSQPAAPAAPGAVARPATRPPATGSAIPVAAPTNAPVDATGANTQRAAWWWRSAGRDGEQRRQPGTHGGLAGSLLAPPDQRDRRPQSCSGWLLCPNGDPGGTAYR